MMKRMTHEQYERRSLAAQFIVGILGSIFSLGVIGLLSWIALTSVETKEAVTRLDERTAVVAEKFRQAAKSLDEHDRRIRDNSESIRDNKALIDRLNKQGGPR